MHELSALLRRRVFGVALGYEDVNDDDGLRHDLALQTACGRASRLASASTVGRLDRAAERPWAWAILKLLVTRFRQAWPEVRIVLRADSGFCRHSRSWTKQRRGIARLEQGPKGANPRYVVSDLKGRGQELYDELTCQRGEMENRIEEQQLDLFADRTSCHKWWPNQFRLILASLAYSLLEAIRRLALNNTEMGRAQAGTMGRKLLKIGAMILRNTRRVAIHLSSACPDQEPFHLAVARLKPG